MTLTNSNAGDLVAQVETLGARIAAVRDQIGRAIFGQQEVVDQTLITLLSGGHVLLVGVPGLGKSRLVETLAIVLGLASKRVQFTPDLMPADILGSEVLDEGADGRRSRGQPTKG
jgi:MoxR-like ATPase